MGGDVHQFSKVGGVVVDTNTVPSHCGGSRRRPALQLVERKEFWESLAVGILYHLLAAGVGSARGWGGLETEGKLHVIRVRHCIFTESALAE